MIRLRDVTWHHGTPPDGGQATLRNITFAIPQGGFRWLLGPSGAGKSTLLRLLHMEALPRSGDMEILGTEIGLRSKRSTLTRLRQRIGMIHQDFRLMPTLSVADNIALPLRLQKRVEGEISQEVDALLDWLGLVERRKARPIELSGGEQQRTTIARAVIMRPSLLLADEPTNALEDTQAARVIGMLRELSDLGTTVIVATHNDTLVQRFPAPALQLRQGRLFSDE
ncbi:cell division ATP-binding protein FtsE [Acetobacter sp.]|jgi:cell division transport system ATP-binding protein|uniref:cell division ATP-binding protein FtsE n=1 Tax=Acetobacter sp. TaxID=440 RepID=UPI0025BC5A2C|nr:ATP-binding cassette domain-containing protein [Acetobacter sp.]MCH4090936.1 ATP-binding cassette domain-containing protein [Acetobacter sp.]MCI1300777.1 ATP-binding cassette domain-containing protein [Acetobacter sp.]MCI1317118.1 ATP-binding cassette domain-containing protein [Acetobacter sp.]